MSSRLRLALPVAAALLVLSACGDNGSSLSANTIPPERVERALAQLDSIVADVFDRSGVPGLAVAAVHQGKVVYAKGFGVRRLGEPETIDADTVFQLASISKSVGATVVAAQVGKGLISWDTPVVRQLPWFALQDPAATAQVTVGDLYAHRSGLPDHAGDELEAVGYGRRQILERLRLLPATPLRTRYAYTNFGLTAAAEAVAVASGENWESLSEQVLYRPLGMSATSSRYTDFMSRTNRAHPHIWLDGAFQPGPQRQPDAQSPAGGLSSSVIDMAKWMELILREGTFKGMHIVSREALLPALEPQFLSSPPTEESPAGYYGYGFTVSTTASGHTRLGHSGAFIMGAGTAFSLLPAADTGIVVLTNALPVGAAEAISASYMDLVELGYVTRDWLAFFEPKFAQINAPIGELAGQPFPENPTPALPVHAYVGTYGNAYYGDARIALQGGQLTLVMGPAGQAFPLRHWDANVFVYEPKGEIAAPGSRSMVSFSMGPGGMAQRVAIEIFDENGLGTLVRGPNQGH